MIMLISKSVSALTGSAQSSQDMIRCLLAAGDKLTVLSLQDMNPNAGFLKNANGKSLNWITYYKPPQKLRFEGNIIEYIKKGYWKYKHPFVNKQVIKKIKQAKPTHIIVNSLGSYELFKQLKLSKQIPTTIVIRESPTTSSQWLGEWTIDWLKKAGQDFLYFIFVSEKVRKEWIALGIVNEGNSFYIPNTIKENITERLLQHDKISLRNELKLGVNKKIIVCIASISFRKGQDLLLDAFEKTENINDDFLLLLVGSKNESNEPILKPIEQMKYRHNIMHIDGVPPEQALAYLAASDIFVLPSRAEAMPRVVLEAMALKKPIIASDVDGIPELITHQKEGLIFQSGKTEKLKAVLEELLFSQEKQQQFSQNAYEKYWRFFSNESQLNRWKEVLRKIYF